MLPPLTEIATQLNVDPAHTFEALELCSGIKPLVQAAKGVLAGKRPIACFYSGVGNGKTHILEASAIELYKAGKFARVVPFSRLLSILKSCIGNPEKNYDEILPRYVYAERLILDDVGSAGSDSDYGNRILEEIIVARYGRRLMTLMTTNMDLPKLPERVLSRLQDKELCYLVNNKAEDYRLKKSAK